MNTNGYITDWAASLRAHINWCKNEFKSISLDDQCAPIPPLPPNTCPPLNALAVIRNSCIAFRVVDGDGEEQIIYLEHEFITNKENPHHKMNIRLCLDAVGHMHELRLPFVGTPVFDVTDPTLAERLLHHRLMEYVSNYVKNTGLYADQLNEFFSAIKPITGEEAYKLTEDNPAFGSYLFHDFVVFKQVADHYTNRRKALALLAPTFFDIPKSVVPQSVSTRVLDARIQTKMGEDISSSRMRISSNKRLHNLLYQDYHDSRRFIIPDSHAIFNGWVEGYLSAFGGSGREGRQAIVKVVLTWATGKTDYLEEIIQHERYINTAQAGYANRHAASNFRNLGDTQKEALLNTLKTAHPEPTLSVATAKVGGALTSLPPDMVAALTTLQLF